MATLNRSQSFDLFHFITGLSPSSTDTLGPYGGCEYAAYDGTWPTDTASQFWGCGSPGTNAKTVAKVGKDKFTTDTGCGNFLVCALR